MKLFDRIFVSCTSNRVRHHVFFIGAYINMMLSMYCGVANNEQLSFEEV